MSKITILFSLDSWCFRPVMIQGKYLPRGAGKSTLHAWERMMCQFREEVSFFFLSKHRVGVKWTWWCGGAGWGAQFQPVVTLLISLKRKARGDWAHGPGAFLVTTVYTGRWWCEETPGWESEAWSLVITPHYWFALVQICNFFWMLVLIAKMGEFQHHFIGLFYVYNMLAVFSSAGIFVSLCVCYREMYQWQRLKDAQHPVPLRLLISLNIYLSKPSTFLAVWPLTILN